MPHVGGRNDYSLRRGTCCPALWPAPCPSLRHTLPVSPSPGTRKFFGVPVGEQISTLFQVQANSEAWKVVFWGLESLLFLRLLPRGGRALSVVWWCGPVAQRCDVICVTLKIVRPQHSLTSNHIALPCGYYIFAKSSLAE